MLLVQCVSFFFSLFYLSGELLALPNRLDGAGVDWNLAANSSLSLARSLACASFALVPHVRPQTAVGP